MTGLLLLSNLLALLFNAADDLPRAHPSVALSCHAAAAAAVDTEILVAMCFTKLPHIGVKASAIATLARSLCHSLMSLGFAGACVLVNLVQTWIRMLS